MKILSYVHAYVGHGRNAGAETTMHDVLRRLVRDGHEVVLLLCQDTDYKEEVVLDGVRIVPFHEDQSKTAQVMTWAKWADVLMTHLECSERLSYISRLIDKPIIHLVHNTMWQTEGYLAMGCDLAIYNSNWVAAHHSDCDSPVVGVVQRQHNQIRVDYRSRQSYNWPYVVLHPPIDYSKYVGQRRGTHIALVNLFASKGADVFYEMARRFPDKKFLGVRGGYGTQVQVKLPNVEYMETQEDFNVVLNRSRLLLMPSVYESFGRVALEAGVRGIPTVASPTPGLLEALGPRGTFADRADFDAWEAAIRRLDSPTVYSAASKEAKRNSKYWAERQDEELDVMSQAVKDLYNKYAML